MHRARGAKGARPPSYHPSRPVLIRRFASEQPSPKPQQQPARDEPPPHRYEPFGPAYPPPRDKSETASRNPAEFELEESMKIWQAMRNRNVNIETEVRIVEGTVKAWGADAMLNMARSAPRLMQNTAPHIP